jgi:hypothetical protein
VIALVLSLIAIARAAETPNTTDDILRRLNARNLPLTAALARAGAPPPESPIAFVPISMSDFLTLARAGFTRAPVEFSAYPNLENPIVARFQKDRTDLRVAAVSAAFRAPLIEHDAWVRGVIDLTLTRARSVGLRPGFDEPVLTQFVSLVRALVDPAADAETFTPDFMHLLEAAARTTTIRVDEPARCETLLTPYMQELFNAGPERRALEARARLHEIASLFDLPWDDVQSPRSRARLALLALFENLPTKAGFKVGLGGPAFNRVRWSKRESPKLYAVELPFVMAIEALGPREQAVLDVLAATPGKSL